MRESTHTWTESLFPPFVIDAAGITTSISVSVCRTKYEIERSLSHSHTSLCPDQVETL